MNQPNGRPLSTPGQTSQCPICERQVRGCNFKKHVKACGRDALYGKPGAQKYRGVKRPHTCALCGAGFLAAKADKQRYCSRGCSNKINAKNTPAGKDAHSYVGGVYVHNASGRAHIRCRDGSTVLYYRALMEAHLRRPLEATEVVHHINGDQADDRLANLQVLTLSAHTALHNALRKAA